MTFNIENPITRLNNQIAVLNNQIAGQIEILTFDKVFDSPEDQFANLVDDPSKLTDKEIIGASLNYSGGDNSITLGKNTTETINDEKISDFLYELSVKILGLQFIYNPVDKKIRIEKTSGDETTITINNNSTIMSKFGFDTNSDLEITGGVGVTYVSDSALELDENDNYFTVDAESDTLLFTTAVTDAETTQTTDHEVSFFSLIDYFCNDLLITTNVNGNDNIVLSVSPFNKLISNDVFIKRVSTSNTLNVTLKLIVKNKE